jgi:hypothetical protein
MAPEIEAVERLRAPNDAIDEIGMSAAVIAKAMNIKEGCPVPAFGRPNSVVELETAEALEETLTA